MYNHKYTVYSMKFTEWVLIVLDVCRHAPVAKIQYYLGYKYIWELLHVGKQQSNKGEILTPK